jgi:hypothetical protein
VYSLRPRFSRRGRWTYFYRDRDFAFHPKKKDEVAHFAELDTTYYTPEDALISRPRQAHQPRWYAPRVSSRLARAVALGAHKRLSQLVSRRLRARRYLLPGIVYSLQAEIPQLYATKAVSRKTLRHMFGRKIGRYRPKYRSNSARPAPHTIRVHTPHNRHLSINSKLVGARLHSILLPRPARLTRVRGLSLPPSFSAYRFGLDLQQELALAAFCAPSPKLKNKTN